MSETQYRAVHNATLDAADFSSPVIGRGDAGMSIKAMTQAARAWSKRQKEPSGWRWRLFLRPKINFAAARQHRPATGVRVFRVGNDNPWHRL